MKYKDIQVGEWFSYEGEIYIKTRHWVYPLDINISLNDGSESRRIADKIEVDFVSSFDVRETAGYVGKLSCSPIGKLVANDKDIYMRVQQIPKIDNLDTIVVYSRYLNAGRWFNSRAVDLEVETFSGKVEYLEK